MPDVVIAGIAGLIAGLVASGAMSLYQSVAATLFGQDKKKGDPAPVKAADSVSRAVEGRPVAGGRQGAGSVVHYATGAALGLLYAILVSAWPDAAIGFGIVFGIVVALVLDDLLVPAFGWGPWPWRTGLATHLYSLTAHAVFGAVLEGARRLIFTALA